MRMVFASRCLYAGAVPHDGLITCHQIQNLSGVVILFLTTPGALGTATVLHKSAVFRMRRDVSHADILLSHAVSVVFGPIQVQCSAACAQLLRADQGMLIQDLRPCGCWRVFIGEQYI